MILFGVEMRNSQQFGDKVDQAFTQGTPNVFDPTTGDLVVHPPVGKWLIGLGEWLFGIDSSFGWRFAVALLGTISIVMVGRAARRLLGSSLLGTIAALLLAVDGHHLVHSRTGLLDIIVMFFALGAFCALLIDRDRTRAILATRMVAAEAADPPPSARWLGPWLGLRPWRWVAAVLLGLCAGTKWSGFYVIAVFGLLTVFWDIGARRAAGIRSWLYAGVVKDGLFALRHDRPHRPARLCPELVGLVSQRVRLQPTVGPHPSRGRPLGVGTRLRAVLVELPGADPRLPSQSVHPASLPVQPLVVAHPGSPDPVLRRVPQERRAGLHGRPVRAHRHLGRHADDLVGGHDLCRHPRLQVGFRARLAGRGDPRRVCRWVPALVPARRPHDLRVLRRLVRPLGSPGRDLRHRHGARPRRTPPASDARRGPSPSGPTSSSRCCCSPTSTRSGPRRSCRTPSGSCTCGSPAGSSVSPTNRPVLRPRCQNGGHDCARGPAARHTVARPARPGSACFWRRSSSWSLWPAAWPCRRPSLASRRRRQACSPHRSGSPWPPA